MNMNGHAMGALNDMHLATVIDNADPDSRGRLRIRLHATGLETWANMVVAGAGNGYGVSCLPKVDEQVVVAFVSPNLPLILGAVWSGSNSQPADAAPVEDRYLLQTPGGLKILMDDSSPKIDVETPAGHHLTITEEGSGRITIEKGGEKIEMTSSGINIESGTKVTVQASQVNVSASMVQVDAGFSQFSGVIKCDTLISNSVVSSTYTPGAGNLW